MSNPTISAPHVSLLPAQLTNIAVFRSAPFVRHPAATAITVLVRGNQAGTLDVEALRFGGDPLVAADWYTYNTPAEQVAVAPSSAARLTINCVATVVRILYTPAAPATLTLAEAWYVGNSGGLA